MGTHLEGADFLKAHLEEACLIGSNLKNAWLLETHLEGANLEKACFEAVIQHAKYNEKPKDGIRPTIFPTEFKREDCGMIDTSEYESHLMKIWLQIKHFLQKTVDE